MLLLSRVCAVFLIFLYFSFIYFHLKTHKELQKPPNGWQKPMNAYVFTGARMPFRVRSTKGS